MFVRRLSEMCLETRNEWENFKDIDNNGVITNQSLKKLRMMIGDIAISEEEKHRIEEEKQD